MAESDDIKDDNQDVHALRKELTEAGLMEIGVDQFTDRIRDVKSAVIVCLRELMELDGGIQERESAAYSLGTLKRLEATLQAYASRPPARSRT